MLSKSERTALAVLTVVSVAAAIWFYASTEPRHQVISEATMKEALSTYHVPRPLASLYPTALLSDGPYEHALPDNPCDTIHLSSPAAKFTPIPESYKSAVDDAPIEPMIHTRWDKPGMCAADGPVLRLREALLQQYRDVHHANVELLVAPQVDDVTWMYIAEEMRRVTEQTALLAKISILAPPVVVHLSLDDLRKTACVHQSAIAYYDGAVHVSADVSAEELRQNFLHEIVHHVLAGKGIHAPMWLQEGLAMYNAHEIWWADTKYGLLSWGLRYHYPFTGMVDAFPHTATEASATAIYFQSIMMVQAIIDTNDYEHIWRLVEALASGKTSPQNAFSWGLKTADMQQQERIWRHSVRSTTLTAMGPEYTVDAE